MKKSSYRPLRRSRTLRRKTLRRKTMRGGVIQPRMNFLEGGMRYAPRLGGGRRYEQPVFGGRKRRTMRGGTGNVRGSQDPYLGGRKRRTMRGGGYRRLWLPNAGGYRGTLHPGLALPLGGRKRRTMR